jgi:hypothetical protein
VTIKILRERREPPARLVELVNRVGGRNRFGQPNFRVIWGRNRTCWIGGKWEDRDDEGNLVRIAYELREFYKYPDLDCWHIERWCPPEAYGSPEGWEELTAEVEDGHRILALGPYPARGEYEHSFAVKHPLTRRPLELTATVCEQVIQAVHLSRQFSANERRLAILAADERSERRAQARDEAVLWNDPSFSGQPYVVVPSLPETLKLETERMNQ